MLTPYQTGVLVTEFLRAYQHITSVEQANALVDEYRARHPEIVDRLRKLIQPDPKVRWRRDWTRRWHLARMKPIGVIAPPHNHTGGVVVSRALRPLCGTSLSCNVAGGTDDGSKFEPPPNKVCPKCRAIYTRELVEWELEGDSP